jgi:hypothetical protein
MRHRSLESVAAYAPMAEFCPRLVSEGRRKSARERVVPDQLWRRILLIVLVPVACLSVVASVATVWAHQTLLDTDRWVATVSPLLDDPNFVNHLSADVAAQITSTLRLEQRAVAALPEQAAFLAAPLADAATRLVQSQSIRVLSSDAGQQVWAEANRAGHERLVAALRGESQLLGTANGMVTFDLTALPIIVLERMQLDSPGLVERRDALPDPTSGRSVEDRRRAIARALGVDIPADFGQIPLFPASQLDAARRGLQLFEALSISLPLVALGLVVAVVLLARARLSAGLVLALGTAAAFILALVLIPDIPSAASAPARPVLRDLVAAILQALVQSLSSLLTVGALLSGIAAGVIGFMVWSHRQPAGESSQKAELAVPSVQG